ncbi:DUF4199 domain-containing protein [Mucilaginibacter sp. OK283]|jgi:hypothetical protein|uniref:DUF4199 domain-containing protein n=1 Tax=Mucilaginibacter sp. OK283 TaxID=1881049 RepID=UPI0008B81D35|nr:DUF4199 domain-containing protein [Mucilaginibacter sp. OK283]SEP33174.1 Protein of unknown function [Mucilaginibacter sp. OK283]
MSEDINRRIKVQGLINGLILGGVLSVVSIIYFYFMILVAKTAVTVTVGSVLFSYVLPIGIAILFCMSLRKKIGGYWNVRQATTGIFIMFFASYLLVFIIKDNVFAKVIEPDMLQKTETAMITALNKLKAENPANAKDVDAKISDMKKALEGEKNITVGQQIQSLGISIIFLFVLALIFAAFFKNEQQVYSSGTGGASV